MLIIHSIVFYLDELLFPGIGDILWVVSCLRIDVCLDGGLGKGFKPLLIFSRCCALLGRCFGGNNGCCENADVLESFNPPNMSCTSKIQ